MNTIAIDAGTFSSVTLELKFIRKLTYHVLRTYVPSILFVLVAWFSMFVPLKHVPGKTALVVNIIDQLEFHQSLVAPKIND